MKHISGISILEVDREIPLSEWARQKITSECFTLDSISHSAVFKSFTRSQKDAIRYQLKKLTRNAGSQRALSSQSKNKTSVFLNEKKVKKGEGTFQGGVKQKGRLDRIEFGSVAFSVFFALLVSLFLLEDFVRFYKAEGLTVSRAVFLAVIAELCIFLGALGWSKVLRRLSKFLIGYNAVLFLALCVMDYTHSSSKNLHYLNNCLLYTSPSPRD